MVPAVFIDVEEWLMRCSLWAVKGGSVLLSAFIKAHVVFNSNGQLHVVFNGSLTYDWELTMNRNTLNAI